MVTTERSAKALAYVDEAIDNVGHQIDFEKWIVSLFKNPIYVLSSIIYQDGMKKEEFVRTAKKVAPDWTERESERNYGHYLRWNSNFENTKMALRAHNALSETYVKVRRAILDHVDHPQDDGAFYIELLRMSQIELTGEEFIQFITAEDPLEAELGKTQSKVPYSINLRGATLIAGIGGCGKTFLTKKILRQVLKNNSDDELGLFIFDIEMDEMKEFGKEYHLNPRSIIKDKKGFASFFQREFEFDEETVKAKSQKSEQANRNTLYVFDDFDEIIGILGIGKAKALVRFFAEEGEKQGKYSIINCLPLRRDVFGEALSSFKNIIAMQECTESDSIFLIGKKGAEDLNKGEMIIRTMGLDKSSIIK